MDQYNIHPDFLKYKITPPLNSVFLPAVQFFMKRMQDMVKIPEGLKETRRKIPGYQDVPVGISIFEPKKEGNRCPRLYTFTAELLPCSQPPATKSCPAAMH